MGFINKIKGGILGETVYYPGCLVQAYLPQIADNYVKILEKMGVGVSVFEKSEFCCGLPALNAGYSDDFSNIVEKNEEEFGKTNKVITNCPSCFRTFKEENSFKAEHVLSVISKNLGKIKKRFDEKATFHDSCDLKRCGLYEEPRKILEKAGFEIVELEKNGAHAECCGACGGLKENSPKIANLLAQKLLKQVKTKKLITACPHCYMHLKENAKEVEVLELSEVLVEND